LTSLRTTDIGVPTAKAVPTAIILTGNIADSLRNSDELDLPSVPEANAGIELVRARAATIDRAKAVFMTNSLM
jgi:hypothetical protein